MDLSLLHSVWFFLFSLFSFSFCSVWCTMYVIVMYVHYMCAYCWEDMCMEPNKNTDNYCQYIPTYLLWYTYIHTVLTTHRAEHRIVIPVW